MTEKYVSLYELNELVAEVISYGMPKSYWVAAEIAELHVSRGHCYIELIEKDEASATPVAKARANIWRNSWNILAPRFERATGEQLRSGMKVLLQVRPNFHPAFGFAWVVENIDPSYTLGDMARRRLEIIQRLKDEGVFELNKELPLPMFAQRIAVVSSATAAGYGDFCNQLENNEYGFVFHTELFDAVMQGERVEDSVIGALDRINERADDFDVVVIIRGGGSTSDLSGFDTLRLAENVANFPLPVITGIGHERDDTVIDMVAHTRVKTPTAAAAFLIENLCDVADILDEAQSRIVQLVRNRMEIERLRLERIVTNIPALFSLVRTRETNRMATLTNRMTAAANDNIQRQKHRIDIDAMRMANLLSARMMRENNRLQMMEQRTASLDPEILLRRGYSITLHNGRAVKNAAMLKPGDIVETRLAEGQITSEVK